MFIEQSPGKLRPLPPLVSSVIHDRRKVTRLGISDVSVTRLPARGGTKVVLICNKVVKDDIQVWVEEPLIAEDVEAACR